MRTGRLYHAGGFNQHAGGFNQHAGKNCAADWAVVGGTRVIPPGIPNVRAITFGML